MLGISPSSPRTKPRPSSTGTGAVGDEASHDSPAGSTARRLASRPSQSGFELDVLDAVLAGLPGPSPVHGALAIAPTIAQPGEYIDFGIPWQELTRTVGQVVGRRPKPTPSSPTWHGCRRPGGARRVRRRHVGDGDAVKACECTAWRRAWRFLTDLEFELRPRDDLPSWPSPGAEVFADASTRRSAGPPRS